MADLGLIYAIGHEAKWSDKHMDKIRAELGNRWTSATIVYQKKQIFAASRRILARENW